MNRRDFQNLSRLRLREARLLLKSRYYEGAYYLAGYSVECAIKACIAKNVNQYDFPNKQLAIDSYSHKIEQLIKVAGLTPQLTAQINANRTFEINWSLVTDWSEKERYTPIVTRQKARDLYSAITSRRNGIMTWLRRLW